MAPTSGFSLAALPRSPNVPTNIGKIGEIDAREIYDAVKAGLATTELAGQGPNRALLANNQAATTLAEGQARRDVLPTLTEATLVDTPNKSRLLALDVGAAEAGAPLNQRGLLAKTLAAEAEATPEMIEAKRKALIAKANAKPVTGLPFLFNRVDELTRALAENPNDPTIAEELAFTRGAITEKQNIAAGKNATTLAAGAATNASREKVAATAAAAGPKSGPAALVKFLIEQGYDDEMIDSVIRAQSAATEKDPTADRASREKVAQARIDAAQTNARAAREQKLATAGVQHQQKLSHALGALEGMENNTKHVDDLINEAIALTGPTTAGLAKGLALLPTDARTLRGKLDSIRANIGFDALTSMRQNSPTGGALGAVSDTENKLLQGTIDSLDQGLSPDVLKANLESVRAQRQRSLENLKRTYDRDVDILKNSPQTPVKVGDKIGDFEIVEIK